MNWTDSKTIRFLAAQWLGSTLLQLVPMLQSHQVDWWALGSQAVATLAGMLVRMGMSDVNAPPLLDTISLGLLNRSNPKP